MSSHDLGKKGESIAREYLSNKGFTILASNFFCRYGELDIIARDPSSLVFIEVKCRKGINGMEQAVGPLKIKNLKSSARCYLHQVGLAGEDFRFMVIYICLPRHSSGKIMIEAIEDPF